MSDKSGGARLIRRVDVLDQGYQDPEIRALIRSGEWQSLRPGAFASGVGAGFWDPADRHRLQVAATIPKLSDDAVVSHASAAVLHGISIWNLDLGLVHVTRRRPASGRRSTYLYVHPAPGGPGEVISVGGFPVTSPARTVVDLARTQPFEQAVVIADHALHLGLVNISNLVDELNGATGRRGHARAGRVLQFADGRSESVGESRSRVAMRRHGLPIPELQQSIYGPDGVFLGRGDFYWRNIRLIGEFDGLTKYGRLLKPGQQPGDVVVAEKLREEAMVDGGDQMLRWTWRDLTEFSAVAKRWEQKRGRALGR